MKKLFDGETMRCELCGATEKSNPKIESGWTAIDTVDPAFHKFGHTLYYCPKCWAIINEHLRQIYENKSRKN